MNKNKAHNQALTLQASSKGPANMFLQEFTLKRVSQVDDNSLSLTQKHLYKSKAIHNQFLDYQQFTLQTINLIPKLANLLNTKK